MPGRLPAPEGYPKCDCGIQTPLPLFAGEEGPAAKRWEARVCTAESARPSPPKPSAWAPPLPRKAGEEYSVEAPRRRRDDDRAGGRHLAHLEGAFRSEERRVGKECRCRWSPS